MADPTYLPERKREVSVDQAWREWDGFVTLAPSEMSAAPTVRLVEGSSIDPGSFAESHCVRGRVQAIGCYFLRDVTYAGMLYPFQAGRLLDDGSHLSRVSADWLRKFPEHRPGGTSNNPPVAITGPVMAVAGPGHQTYGHWIIDFLPRLAIARDLLGSRFAELRFLVLADTPQWGKDLMAWFFGIGPDRLLEFEFAKDEFVCEQLCYPTFAHSYPFFLHSFIERFYRSVAVGRFGDRRLCVQRRPNHSGRNFVRREEFERLARNDGYELVDPEGMTIEEQSALFRSAAVVIGEYGSALHNSVFSAERTRFGVLNAPGVEQTRLCAAFGQPVIYAVGSGDRDSWTLSDEQLASFFETLRRAELPSRAIGDRAYVSLETALLTQPWRVSERSGNVQPCVVSFGRAGLVDGGGALAGAIWTVSDGQLVLTTSPDQDGSQATLTFTQMLSVGEETFLFMPSAGPDCIRLATLPQQLDPTGARGKPDVGAFTTGHEAISNPHDVPLWIGKFCTIGPGVHIAAAYGIQQIATHPLHELGGSVGGSPPSAGFAPTAVIIGNDVRIEDRALLNAGVAVGDGSIIRAGAVVTKDIPPYAVVEGNPATVVSLRFDPDQIARITALRWWDWPIEKLQSMRLVLASTDIEGFLSAAGSPRTT